MVMARDGPTPSTIVFADMGVNEMMKGIAEFGIYMLAVTTVITWDALSQPNVGQGIAVALAAITTAALAIVLAPITLGGSLILGGIVERMVVGAATGVAVGIAINAATGQKWDANLGMDMAIGAGAGALTGGLAAAETGGLAAAGGASSEGGINGVQLAYAETGTGGGAGGVGSVTEADSIQSGILPMSICKVIAQTTEWAGAEQPEISTPGALIFGLTCGNL